MVQLSRESLHIINSLLPMLLVFFAVGLPIAIFAKPALRKAYYWWPEMASAVVLTTVFPFLVLKDKVAEVQRRDQYRPD